MQAIVYHRYGSPDVLELQEIPKPVPDQRQVLLRVHAASVNPYDWHFMRGLPYVLRIATGLRQPKNQRLGVDVAGVVEAVGRAVTHLKPGDEVFGAVGEAALTGVCCEPHPETEIAITATNTKRRTPWPRSHVPESSGISATASGEFRKFMASS